ncbi:MAG: UDP-N-acetylmuramate dehydrogenase [Acidobacteria bacterium]|nr:MAG: UDP-N-acetylmuramate dehydrogenase [Acidobacteriota bacterium]
MILRGVSLSPYTTIGIGGIGSYFALPKDLEELRYVLDFAKDRGLSIFPLGRGANTIFGDFDGLVVSMKNFRELRVKERDNLFYVWAGSGVPLKELVRIALKEDLDGMYKLAGFPATVGGAVAMNAGAFGYEISQHLKRVIFLDWDGQIQTANREELTFAYRSSPFPELGIVVNAEFVFPKADYRTKQEYSVIRSRRKATQPINLPTCGSTFKNPPGEYAGRLLEKVGMRGYRVGGVSFSEKHANFLVNLGGGTYEQVVRILEEAKKRVYEEFGIELQEEVRLVESGSPYGWKVCGT